MIRPWTVILSLVSPLVSFTLVYALPKDGSFENTAVVRTVELAGSTTHVTTSYQFKPLQGKETSYWFALSEADAARTSWMEAKWKGSKQALNIEQFGFAAKNHVWLYHVALPKLLKTDETATLVVETLQSHASYPLPASVKQTEPLKLVYETEAYVLSPYKTTLQRTKLRAPSLKIVSYDEPQGLLTYMPDGEKPASKSGASVTYGPFHTIPPSTSRQFLQQEQKTVKIHYEYEAPVLTVSQLKRSAEISHWGANLNVEDRVWLKNDGATLKGFFSRIEHAKQVLRPQLAQPHVLKNVVLHLPSGVRDPYYYDIIGNVSTSHFRPAPKRQQSSLTRASPMDQNSIIDLKPRYPLLGGWNYTFTVGYDMPLEDWVTYDASSSQYIVAIPFLTPIPGATYDDVEFKVILPELANVIAINPPFEPSVIERDTHVTYLDTSGRPMIVFRGKNLTDKHAGLIYVTYSVSTAAHLRKPLTVAAAFLGTFLLALALRRVEFTLHPTVRHKKLQ